MGGASVPLRAVPTTHAVLLPHIALNILLVVASYYALAVVGTVLSVPPAGFAIIWPATALLVSILILAPARHWWVYLLAVVPAHFHMVYHFQNSNLPLVVVLCQLLGNFSLAIITALAVRTTSEAPLRFDNLQSIVSFILLAGLAVPAIVNALTICLHVWTGWTTDFWLSWRQWMLASVFPTVTIPPLVISAARRHFFRDETQVRRSYAELGLLLTALILTSIFLFSWDQPKPEYLPIVLLAPLLPLLWVAIRLGVGGTSLSLLVFAGAISASALAGRGPFALGSPLEDVLSLQVFLNTVSVPLLLLAAVVVERTQAEASLRLSEQRLLTLQQEAHQRIAQELHDSTMQHLTGMSLNLMALRNRASTGADATGIFEDIRASLKVVTRELRSFSYFLYPTQVQREGLHATLQRYIEGFAGRTQLAAHIRATGRAAGTIDALPLPVQEALLRIVQESLANVYRHASASRVTVKLRHVGHRLHLVIADDGTGNRNSLTTEDNKPLSRGVGIPGMKARARQIGGRLDIRRRFGGTIVHVVVPIRR
jgi:signal transduction histidine kinase